MIVSGLKHRDMQLKFWSPPIRSHAYCRNYLGEIVEEATEKLTGGRRHKTQGNVDYCPDVSAGEIFYECKSAGRQNQTFVYAGRLEKDLLFAAEHILLYAVWHHAVDTTKVATVDELRAAFYATLRGVYLVPFAAVYGICAERKLEKLNSEYGKGGGYGEGYRFNVSSLAQWRVK